MADSIDAEGFIIFDVDRMTDAEFAKSIGIPIALPKIKRKPRYNGRCVGTYTCGACNAKVKRIRKYGYVRVEHHDCSQSEG